MELIVRNIITILALLAITGSATHIYAAEPQNLRKLFPHGIKAHISPIGFKPLSGRLEGNIVLANPIGACNKIDEIKNKNEDFFVLADDTQCLQSVKAKNIAVSGGYAGIIKQNINNTLYDKEVNLVHIPMLEINPADYDKLVTYLNSNKDSKAALSIDFTDLSQTRPVNVEMWFSPTEKESYEFLLEMREFLTGQDQHLSFRPHYVLQSHRETTNFLGCYSSGRYCPTEIQYKGKPEGANIVKQTLKQIIIWDIDPERWWNYIEQFYYNCIKNIPDAFLNSSRIEHCSENAVVMAGVKQSTLKQEFNSSFLGNVKEVHDNTYLLEERQLFVREQVKYHPSVLVNKKVQKMKADNIKNRVCKIEGSQPSQFCYVNTNQLTTSHVLIIIFVILAVFIGVAALYRVYMHLRMRKEIKGQVNKTLEQYYRYIQTFEEDHANPNHKKQYRPQRKSKQLNQSLEEVPELTQKLPPLHKDEVEMSDVKKQLQ